MVFLSQSRQILGTSSCRVYYLRLYWIGIVPGVGSLQLRPFKSLQIRHFSVHLTLIF